LRKSRSVTAVLRRASSHDVCDLYIRMAPEPHARSLPLRTKRSSPSGGPPRPPRDAAFSSRAAATRPGDELDASSFGIAEESVACWDRAGSSGGMHSRALRAARETLEVRLRRFNEWIRSEGLDDGFRMGVGHTGWVVSGHVGLRASGRECRSGRDHGHRLTHRFAKGTPDPLALSASTRDSLVGPAEPPCVCRRPHEAAGLNEDKRPPAAETAGAAQAPA
jgi:hypothetical protein